MQTSSEFVDLINDLFEIWRRDWILQKTVPILEELKIENKKIKEIALNGSTHIALLVHLLQFNKISNFY